MASNTEPETSSTTTTTTTTTKRPAPAEDEGRSGVAARQQPVSAQDGRSVTPPQPKRRRVADNARVRSAKACQRCRRLKEKCDGQQPCQRCSRSGRVCEFAPAGMSGMASSTADASSITARGIGAHGVSSNEPGYSSADSKRLEERTKCLEQLVHHLLGDVPMDLNNLRRMAEKASQRSGSGSEDAGARAGTEDLDDLTLEDENFTVKTLSQSTAHYSGEFSHWNFSQKLRRRLSQCLDTSDVAIPAIRKDLRTSSNPMPPPPGRNMPSNRAGMRIMEYWRATQLQSPKTLVQGVLGCLPPRAVSSFLVQIYFQFAQVNCFYVEESWLRKKLNFLYEAPGHVTSEDSAWVCSVLMVLGIGTQFAHMAAGPPGDGDGEDRKTTPILPGDSDSDVGVTFYQTASKLIPDIITIASMESVRAFLLLAHYVLPLDTQGLSYTYLGLGMKMAIQNGMHRRYQGTDLDAWTIETRNRLWWTAYTVERRVSVLHGRPASIAATEVDADLPKDLAEFRQPGDNSKFSNISALIEMTLRLGDVANAITLLRRCPKNLQHTYFERIVDICQSLRAWWQSLPPETRDPVPSLPSFRSNAHLKLCLHLNDIFVGRPFIFSHSTGASPGSVSSPGTTRLPDTPASHLTPHDRPRNRAALADRAVEAAMSIISLLRILHETTGLARSSYTEFSSCRASLLVMLAQSVNGPQTLELKAAIDVGMQLIRRMAAGNVSTQSETSVIEALETAVRRLHEMQHSVLADHTGEPGEGAPRPRGKGTEQVDAGKSGYERFREWASLWPPGGGSDAHGGGGGGEIQLAAGAVGFADTRTPPSYGMPPAGLPPPGLGRTSEHSPESSRWLTMMDTGMGIGVEQLDDLGLFGGFPELGALDGWPGLT